jgi:hypothetical protein
VPYANNVGIQIHYKVEGDGPALVLQQASRTVSLAKGHAAARELLVSCWLK